MRFVQKIISTSIILLSLSALFGQNRELNALDAERPENATTSQGAVTTMTSQGEQDTTNSQSAQPLQTTQNAQNEADFEDTKPFDILNEILIASITGVSENPLVLKFIPPTHPLTVIFKCPKRLDGRHTITLLDYYMPKYMGLVASSVPYNAAEENLAWLDTILASDGSGFEIKRPHEFEKTKSEVEEFLAEEGIEMQRDESAAQTDSETNEKAGENASSKNADTNHINNGQNAEREFDEDADVDAEAEQGFPEDDEYANAELDALIQSSHSAIAEEKKEEEKIEVVPEKKIKNAENMLSMHSYGNEIFSIKERGNKRISITSFEKKLTRHYFDDKMRVIRKEIWDLNGGINGAHKTKTENFAYNGDSTIAERSTTIEGDARYQQKYDEQGRIIERRNFMVLKNADGSQQIGGSSSNNSTHSASSANKTVAVAEANTTSSPSPEQKRTVILKNRTTWKYNANGQIAEKYFVEYTYKDENSTQIVSRNSKKEVFLYKIQDGPPDYSYYENNVLRMQTEYSGRDDYKTTSYFDDGFVVESFYEGGMHKRDYYYLNGSLVRSRDYE